MAKIIKAKIHNFMGLDEAIFDLKGESAIIGGKNGQGKSSLIRALMAVGGKRLLPDRPVKEGADRANVGIQIETEQGKYIAKFTFTEDRKVSLVVTSSDNAIVGSPQTFLSNLFSGVSFDPGAFKDQKPKEQRETLLKLVGVDLSEMDLHYQQAYSERTEVNREIKSLKAQVDEFDRYDGSMQEIDVAAGQRRLDELRSQANEIKAKQALHDQATVKIAEKKAQIAILQNEIAQIEIDQDSLTKAIEQLPKPSREEAEKIKTNIAQAADLNYKIKQEKIRRKKAKDLEAMELNADELTQTLIGIQQAKIDTLASAKFPIENLSVDEECVTYYGRPLDQASEAERWKVSLAVGFALNPDGVMFMPTTGGLDRDSREAIIKQAEKLGVQLILEVVDTPDDCSLIVEAGRIKQ